MLHKWLSAGPVLSRGVVRLVVASYVLLYVAVYAKASTFLPEFIFRDADKIRAQIDGSSTYAGTSFDAVGRFYALFGPAVNLFVIGIGVSFIWTMLRRANRPGLLAAALLLSVPCVFLNLFIASKDTLVVLMSLLLLRAARDARPHRAIVAAAVLYGTYAVLVRSYFALIVAIGIGVFMFRRTALRWRIVAAAAVAVLVFLLPDAVYVALLHPRDMAVDYLVYQSPYGARTSFYNPVDPSTFVGFVADYLYAVGKLNAALLFSPGIKEFVMQLFVVLVVYPALCVAGGRTDLARTESHALLACLVMGHVCVSMLFEPDLGSYTRHLSSVALFSMTLLTDWASARRGAPRVHSAAAATGRT